ncbi:hypothetical protein V6N13_031762 [Hibiscus sabdariffa]
MKKLRVEKDGINKEQNNIKEVQGQLRQKLEAIDVECEQLRQETIMVTRQSVNTQIRLALMFQILKARENHDFSQASHLTSALRFLGANFFEVLRVLSLLAFGWSCIYIKVIRTVWKWNFGAPRPLKVAFLFELKSVDKDSPALALSVKITYRLMELQMSNERENPVRSTAMRKRMASEIFDYHSSGDYLPLQPNLAALLEYKLCSLMDPLERRRKEALPLHLSEVTLSRHHGQQQQSSSGLTLNLDSAIDSLSNYSFSDSGALNQYVSWEIPPIPISSNNHQINSSFYELGKFC